MGDLTNSKLIWTKGFLFLFLGILSSGILLLRTRDLQVALLLGIAIWSFCRSYYFAFYVIEHYVDPRYRFAGLADFLRYATGKRIPKEID